MSAGYIQLFFGDVENYTMTAVWIMGYLLASLLFLKERWSIISPSLLVAAALTYCTHAREAYQQRQGDAQLELDPATVKSFQGVNTVATVLLPASGVCSKYMRDRDLARAGRRSGDEIIGTGSPQALTADTRIVAR